MKYRGDDAQLSAWAASGELDRKWMSSLCTVHADDGTEILKVQIELGVPHVKKLLTSRSREFDHVAIHQQHRRVPHLMPIQSKSVRRKILQRGLRTRWESHLEVPDTRP